MFHLAHRNLFQSKTKALMAMGGVALAFMLIFSLDAVLAGLEGRIASFIERTGADVWVAQSGVRNMHMASSTIPRGVVDQVRAIDGVADASPVRYLTNVMVRNEQQYIAYVIGLPEGATMGTPAGIAAGDAYPKPGEVIVDGALRQEGAGLGDTVRILGADFRIGGLAEGLASTLSSLAFIRLDDFDRLLGSTSTTSYVLVRVAQGVSPDDVAARIEAAVPGVTASSTARFGDEERKVVRDMSTEIAAIMNLAGVLIGLAVMALSVYTATVSRLPEFGLLRALGAARRHCYGVVLGQAVLTVTLAFGLGLALTYAASVIAPLVDPLLYMQITWPSIVKAAAISLVVAGLAAALPIAQISGVDPAIVFRRKVA
jgi:putative ABC transport system permease protein